MRPFLNCTVKMFRNCKQTGHKEKTKWEVQSEIWITQEHIMTGKYDWWVWKEESHLGAFAERDRENNIGQEPL